MVDTFTTTPPPERSVSQGHISASQQGRILDTRSGERVPMPAIPVPDNDNLEEFACVVTSTENSDLLVTFAFTATTPSAGLTPEERYTQLVMLDGVSKEATATVRLPAPVDSFRLQPATDGGVYFLEQSRYDGKPLSLRSYEPKTLAQRVEMTAEPSESLYVTYAGYATTRKTGTQLVSPTQAYDQWVAEFFDGTDGSKVGEFPNVVSTDMQATPAGFLMYHGGGDPSEPGVFLFDMQTRKTSGPVAPYLADTSSYGDLLLLKGARDGAYLTVYDRKAEKEVFALDQQQIEGLKIDLSNTYLGSNYLYVTNESDNPVIDLTTGQPVHSGWSLVPLSPLKEGWELIWPAGPGEALAPQGIYPDSLYAARGESGDYDGPWY
ncbi:hypothetical protein ACAG25_04705 [Mycobacterium sp. pV006]|uniref:hypothetical protein n=1 Tax=Mycobacterium sp. pV006 TaxID=3238983 RepID=UPI00351B7128